MSINQKPVNITFSYTPSARPLQSQYKSPFPIQASSFCRQRAQTTDMSSLPMQRLGHIPQKIRRANPTIIQHTQSHPDPPISIESSQQKFLKTITQNLITEVTKSIADITKAQITKIIGQKQLQKEIDERNRLTIKKPYSGKSRLQEKSENIQRRVVNRYSSLQSPKKLIQRPQTEENNFLFELFNFNRKENKSQMRDFISTNWKESNQNSLKEVQNVSSENTSTYMKQMIKELKCLNQNKKQTRAIELQIELGQCPTDERKREQYLKETVAKIISKVISVGFNMHYKEGTEFEKVKAYCCQNFLYNFCKLVTLAKISRKDMKILQDHLQEDVLRYLNLSYPRSQQKLGNKELKSKIDEKDTFNENRFDIVYNSKVPMSIKPKDSNAQIMKIMNYIIQLPDEKVVSNEFYTYDSKQYQKEYKTLYEMFEEDMSAILTRVYSRQLVEHLYKLNRPDRFKIRDKIWQKKQAFANSKQLMEEIDEHVLRYNGGKFEQRKNRKDSQNQYLSLNQYSTNNRFSSEKYLKEHSYKNSRYKYDDAQNKQKEELQYKEKVQNYTKFKIGRKIQSHVQPYTEEQIEEGALIVKDSSVARVLMKWVQALQNEIQDPSKNTYARDEPYRLSNEQETYLLSREAQITKLYKFYQRSANVIKEKSQILKNNARQIFLQALKSSQLTKFKSYKTFSSDKDAKIGHICTLLQKCKQNHISSYLNMIINEIKYIEQQYQYLIMDKKVSLSSRPSLITMKLGDLMRCQITSKPKQIIALYEYICIVCKTNNTRFELVRVKDRLCTTNKDILLNIFYHKKIMIEIQLAIKNESAFISCSDKFSHFLYQLMRAFLGPINEICSIWSQFSPKAPFFVEKFTQINIRAQQIFNPNCIRNQNHQYQDQRKGFKLPFWCSTCGVLYHNDSVVRKVCRYCKIYRCGICEIKGNHIQFIQSNYPKLQLISAPEIGKIFYALDIGTSHMHMKVMMKVQINGKIEVFSMKIEPDPIEHEHKGIQNQPPRITNIKSEYQIVKRKSKCDVDVSKQIFQQSHIILGRKDILQENEEYEKILINEIITKIVSQYYLPSRMKMVAKKYQRFLKLSIITNPPLPTQRKSELINVVLNDNEKALRLLQKLNLNENGLQKLDIANKMPLIRGIALCDNKLESIVLEGFHNLTILQLSANKISSFFDLKFLNTCTNLKKLLLDGNALTTLEGLPSQLRRLQILSLKKNKISVINLLPPLPSLICLNLNQNKVNALNGLEKVKGLQELRLRANSFIGSKGVQYLKQLKQLRKLDLSFTNLSKTLCQSVALGKDGRLQQIFIQTPPTSALQISPLIALNTLDYLEELDLSNNHLKFIPQMSKLIELKELNLYNNNLTTVKNLQFFHNLSWLNLRSNKIKNLESLGSLKNLKWIDLSDNEIQSKWLSKLSELSNLQQLELSQNELTTLEGIGNLKNLYELSFRSNQVTSLKGIQKLTSLQHLDASSNEIKSLQGIQNLPLLIKLKLSNNAIQSFKPLQSVQNLKILELNWARLDQIGKIPRLKNLQQLYLNNNQIKSLKGIENFQSLKKLEIKYNIIDSIEEIKHLKFLSFLSFSLNQNLTLNVLGEAQSLQVVRIQKKKSYQPAAEQQHILIGLILMGCNVEYEEV